MRILIVAVLVSLWCAGCGQNHAAGTAVRSLGGRVLRPAEIDPARRAVLALNLAGAQGAFDADPSEEHTIWLGRRLAYLGEFRRAIGVYSDGIERFPMSYRLLRHRGHRYITIREFDLATRDLSRAAMLAESAPDAPEPDGDPNPSGVPRSTDKSNIYYHLGLVHYLSGRYDHAETWFSKRGPLELRNDDMVVSEAHWRVLSLLRLGREADAMTLLEGIRPSMDIRENANYHRLCLFYKGHLSHSGVLGTGPPDASVAYGLAAWLHAHGQPAECARVRSRIFAETNWAAFGHIAAEADLARERP